MKAEVITISRIKAVEALKEMFYNTDPETWSKRSNRKLGDWYKVYILKDKDAKIKVV